MADDLNKNITIQVTAQTDQLEQSINNLNKIIDSLLAKQKQLADAGNQNSAAFQNNADKIDIFQKSLLSAITQLSDFLLTFFAKLNPVFYFYIINLLI